MEKRPENSYSLNKGHPIEINGLILRCVIQERGLTRKEVAEKIGCAHQQIWNWMWNKNNPVERNFYKLCEVLDINPSMLALSSEELVEHGRTNRVVRWNVKEILGKNEPPRYEEVQQILNDLTLESSRDSEEEEVREEVITVLGEGKPHPDPESDTDGSDEVSGS